MGKQIKFFKKKLEFRAKNGPKMPIYKARRLISLGISENQGQKKMLPGAYMSDFYGKKVKTCKKLRN